MITIKGHLTGRGNTKGKIMIKKERTMANWRFRDQLRMKGLITVRLLIQNVSDVLPSNNEFLIRFTVVSNDSQ